MMRSAILTLVLCSAVAASAQDLTITSKMTEDGGKPEIAKSYVSSDHVRMSEPRGNDVIFDLKSGDMTVLDGTKKTYYVITQKDIDEMIEAVKERMNSPEMKQAQEQMKNLPPDLQKRMQSMMGAAMQTEVKKTGTTRTVAGYRCENWTITIGQVSQMEQCVTTELKFPAAAWDRFKSFNDRMRSMSAAMGPMASGMDKMREELEKVKGFPIARTQTTTVMGHKSTSTSEVTEVSHGPIPASAWTVPGDYKRVESPMKREMEQLKQQRR